MRLRVRIPATRTPFGSVLKTPWALDVASAAHLYWHLPDRWPDRLDREGELAKPLVRAPTLPGAGEAACGPYLYLARG